MDFGVPILLLVFNRPDLTAQVMTALRPLRPKRIFVAADGPRKNVPGEIELCERTREIAATVDWECEVTTLFRETNLGCGPAVSAAITWFFEKVEEGIILEDDCLPSLSFFEFCADSLERFREDTRIGTISGDYFLPPDLLLEQPYYFSKYFQIWGWATWRRTWQKYRFDLSFESEENWQKILEEVHSAPLESKYWLEVLEGLKNGTVNTWDYQMMFISWRERFLHVMPTRNLVSNIGYRPDATHTFFESPLDQLPRNDIRNFRVDVEVCALPQIDNLTFYVRFLESLHSVWWLKQALHRQIEFQLMDEIRHLDAKVGRLEHSSHQLELSHQWMQRVLQSFRILAFAGTCLLFLIALFHFAGISLPLGGLALVILALFLGGVQLAGLEIVRPFIEKFSGKIKRAPKAHPVIKTDADQVKPNYH
jgi:hypothetical protein